MIFQKVFGFSSNYPLINHITYERAKSMSKNLFSMSGTVSCSFEDATGSIDYGFTNDYMFRALLQQNNHVLKGLICSLLHLKTDEVISVEITNPILPGDNIDMKEFIMDIQIVLNNNTLINLEMQVVNEKNWPERSLSYLCRRFDQLSKGQDYTECKPAIHIGFLDFTPFPEHPEFYATYMMKNIKNHNLYSDKLILCVVDLTHIELATNEDRTFGIDHWAMLFKANTWEELKMIANNSQILTEASKALYQLNADEIMRQRCRAREDFILHENAMKRQNQALNAENAALNAKVNTLISEKESVTAEKEALATENRTLITQIDALTSAKVAWDAEREQLLAELVEYRAKDAENA